MFEMVLTSAKLFVAGKLFQDNAMAMRQLAIGVGAGVIAIVVLSKIVPLWAATIVGGALTGFLQPMLFKDLKYA